MRFVLCGCGFDGGEWVEITVQHSGWMDCLSFFLLVMGVVVAFLFLLSVCHPYSLRSLRSCVCSPVCALCCPSIRSSMFRFEIFRCSVLLILCLISLSLLGRASGSFVLFHLHRFFPHPPPPPLRCHALPLPLHPASDRRATAYCTYVFSSEM